MHQSTHPVRRVHCECVSLDHIRLGKSCESNECSSSRLIPASMAIWSSTDSRSDSAHPNSSERHLGHQFSQANWYPSITGFDIVITSIDDASAGIGSQRGALLVPLAGSCAPYCRLGARETRSSTLARPVHPLIQFSPLSFPAGSLRGRDLGPKQAGHSGRPLSASLT